MVSQTTEPVSANCRLKDRQLVNNGKIIILGFMYLSIKFPSVSPGLAVAPPNSLNVSPPGGGGGGVSSSHRKRRTLIAPEMNLSLDQSEGSLLSDDFLDTPDDLDINVDDIDTPDETDSLEFITNGNELEWEGKWLKMYMHNCTLF